MRGNPKSAKDSARPADSIYVIIIHTRHTKYSTILPQTHYSPSISHASKMCSGYVILPKQRGSVRFRPVSWVAKVLTKWTWFYYQSLRFSESHFSGHQLSKTYSSSLRRSGSGIPKYAPNGQRPLCDSTWVYAGRAAIERWAAWQNAFCESPGEVECKWYRNVRLS